jgi:hypothetical protein
MINQFLAARLREGRLSLNEAEAIMDVIQIAARVAAYGWGEGAPAGCVTAHLDLQFALGKVLNQR